MHKAMAAESEFVGMALEVANQLFPESQYRVQRGAVLLYRITVDDQLTVRVDVRKPVRGNSAFETDLCVFEKRDAHGGGEAILIPRVVLEFKTSITTHDVLTYSAKAKRHKQIYPYLRYGIVSSSHKEVPGRFFTHNESLDFCASVAGLPPSELSAFFGKLLSSELNYSKQLEKIAFDKSRIRSRVYQNIPVFDGATGA
jgi:hypothetical protein